MDNPFIQRSDSDDSPSPLSTPGEPRRDKDDGLRKGTRYVLVGAGVCLVGCLASLVMAHALVGGYLDVVQTAPGGGWLLMFFSVPVGLGGLLLLAHVLFGAVAIALVITGVVLLVVRLYRKGHGR